MAKHPRDLLSPQLPPRQSCAKCDAEFSWEPSDPLVKGSALIARLAKVSDKCDCGYGNATPIFDN